MRLRPTSLVLSVLFLLPIAVLAEIDLAPYRAWAEERWGEDIAALEELDNTESHGPDSVLFIGSSSIRLWESMAEDLAPFDPIQRGYGGAKLSDVAFFAERLLKAHRPRAVVYFVGNDISGADNDKKPEEMVELFAHIRETTRRMLPDVPVFYISITPTPARLAVWRQTDRSNALMKDYCESQPETYFIATRDLFMNANGEMNPAFYADDELHLSKLGYGLWGEQIKRELHRVLDATSGDAIAIWPGLAPSETRKLTGTALPGRTADQPPITRVEKITFPTLQAFLPKHGGNGAAVLVLPGGGFRYVVPDLEGSEAAPFLNDLGLAVFVLNYRTDENSAPDRWRRPLQDSQRAIRYLRANAARWNLDPEMIGLLAFSAGGQVGAIHIGDFGDAYAPVDAVDSQSARPDFALLVYPWNVADSTSGALIPEIRIGPTAPPTFLVHTGDDQSSSLGSLAIYTDLKKAGVPAELHVYENGGHGYGTRDRDGSIIGTWPLRAATWIRAHGWGR